MPSRAPIGVFDSGVGGLSILIEIRRLLPDEDLIYLADSANCPYGVKPPEEIRRRTLEITGYLIGQGAKMIVVACNSACVAGLDQVRAHYPDFPIVGVEPGVKPAHGLTRNGKIGVLATSLTLKGDRFNGLVERFASGVEVFTRPAPGLVELVEAGELDTPRAEELLHQYIDPLLVEKIDTLVLGCTHYPFFRPLIEKICGPGVTVVDTGLAVARQTARVLEQHNLAADKTDQGRITFYTSGDPDAVAPIIRLLWPEQVGGILKADI